MEVVSSPPNQMVLSRSRRRLEHTARNSEVALLLLLCSFANPREVSWRSSAEINTVVGTRQENDSEV